jgi:glycosyltransferase involved in cell wall biosynthesis
MRVLLVTDAFPPICGGSGWSTYELARGLRRLGHEITIVRPRPGEPPGEIVGQYEDFAVREFGTYAPGVPFIRNYFKNERLARVLASYLRPLIKSQKIDIVHGQHLLSAPGAIRAARQVGVPVITTVRDYWPVCYWSDLIYDYDAPTLCPACSAGMMRKCVRPRAGRFASIGKFAIPYMVRNLAWRRRTLSQSDTIIAVSSAIAHDLRTRAPELARTRIEIIPNPVDVQRLRGSAQTLPPDVRRPYAVYVGKLAPNKGANKLVPAIIGADLTWPVIVIGDGPSRVEVETAAKASGCDIRFTGWLSREAAHAWLAHASMVIFPSHGPESLSRVLLEASALGISIAAMETGGTRDIIAHEATGLLSSTVEELSEHVARLAKDAMLRARLGGNARRLIDSRFESSAVVARVSALYEELTTSGTRSRAANG